MAEKKFYVAYVARECGMNIGAFAASSEEAGKLIRAYADDMGVTIDIMWMKEFESPEDACIQAVSPFDVLVINDKEAT